MLIINATDCDLEKVIQWRMSVPYMPVLKKKSKKKSYHFNLSRVDIIIILLCVKKSYYSFWNILTLTMRR